MAGRPRGGQHLSHSRSRTHNETTHLHAAEAFRLASQLVPGSYDLQFVGTSSSLRSCVGLQLHKLQPLPAKVPDHSIVVVTGVTTSAFDLESEPFKQVTQWLALVARNETVTLMCVCSGSLLAANAGLLRGRECTTHHDLVGQLAKLEPSNADQRRDTLDLFIAAH